MSTRTGERAAMNGAVVVGVDGSRTAWAALAWAAGDAGRRELPLRIVHVREPWLAERPLSASSDQETLTERCDRLLAAAADRAHELAPGARTSTALVTGAVIERLRSESETADTVVVGSRGLGGFAGLVLGSVGFGLAGYAESPVVVVRRPPRDGSGEIVVGYDASPCADMALEYALAQAVARRARLRVLYGRRYPYTAPHPVGYGPLPVGEADEIGRRLALRREKYPEVELIESIVDEHPVPALAAASRVADLVVVGSRGLGGFTSAMLGSVSRGVLQRAHCPVSVVSAPRRRPLRRTLGARVR
ncbi:universal stress protein [Nonomuraea angiospora]|uniref:universal stress protein n=1 Tax=Nonomuraea angiospora TaxID=46172 RepID=UPI0029A581BB|nr:universal stress protein [Nonomuraea angiospora]MDX3110002.1 universal stress protein [Nonomuraea angiospora]